MVMKCPYCGKELEVRNIQTNYTHVIKKYHIDDNGKPFFINEEVNEVLDQNNESYLVCSNIDCDYELSYEYEDGLIKLYPYIYGNLRITLAEYIARTYEDIDEESLKMFAKEQKIEFLVIRDFIHGKISFLNEKNFNKIIQLFEVSNNIKEIWKHHNLFSF